MQHFVPVSSFQTTIDPRAKQRMLDSLFVFHSDESRLFKSQYKTILLDPMEDLFGTHDPRAIFGADCFVNKETVLNAREILVSKYSRERDVLRGKVVNQLADILTWKQDEGGSGCKRFARYIKELRLSEPAKAVAAKEVEKLNFFASSAAASKVDQQQNLRMPNKMGQQQKEDNEEEEYEWVKPPLCRDEPVILPSSKDPEAEPPKENCSQFAYDPIPAYLGKVNKPTLLIGLHNSHRAPNEEKHPCPEEGKDGACPRCGKGGHRVSRCPRGGSVKRVDDNEYKFTGLFYKCFVCGIREGGGHFSETCPWRHPDAKRKSCFNCASPNHRAGQCPLPRRGPQLTDKPILPTSEMRQRDNNGRVVKLAEQFPELIQEQQKRKVVTEFRMYVGNLDKEVKERDLHAFLDGFGVKNILMKKNDASQKYFAYVDFYDEEQAKKACYYRGGRMFFGKHIVMQKANPKPSRSSTY